jgi:hypothetical protein
LSFSPPISLPRRIRGRAAVCNGRQEAYARAPERECSESRGKVKILLASWRHLEIIGDYDIDDVDWKMRVAIHDDLDGPSRLGVLCHELAHILSGYLGCDRDYWWPSRIDLSHHAIP